VVARDSPDHPVGLVQPDQLVSLGHKVNRVLQVKLDRPALQDHPGQQDTQVRQVQPVHLASRVHPDHREAREHKDRSEQWDLPE
jgi:hypothetical protein